MKIGMLASAHKAHTHRWCRWLARRGHDVVLYSDTDALRHMEYENVRIVRPDWTMWRKLVAFKIKGGPLANNREKWRAYRNAILADQPDVLHAQEALAYGPILPHFPGVPRVLTPWGPDIERLAHRSEEADLVRSAVEAADLIATNAPGLEEHWSTLTRLPPDRFRLFSWGTDLRTFFPRPHDEQLRVRRWMKLPEEGAIVVSPRLAKPHYRIDTILNSWKSLSPDAALVVLRAGGDVDNWLRLEEMTSDRPDIRMFDAWMNADELAALYSTSSAVVMNPESDLLAMSVLEAVACGALPVVNDLPCYRSALNDFDDPRENRGSAIFCGAGSMEEIAAGMERALAVTTPERADIARRQCVYTESFQDRNVCMAEMEKVYETVISCAGGNA